MAEEVQQNKNIIALSDEAKNVAGVAVESSKAVQMVQAALVVAKRFPRDEVEVQRKIDNACMRVGLAKVSTFAYSRGGTAIKGPTIKLLEAIAGYWGNIDFGWKEVERRFGESTIQASAWDMETNTKVATEFTVKHVRDKWKEIDGKKIKVHEPITDDRDIYELNANYAARRVRACLERVIPRDIVQTAVETCERTLLTKEPITKDSLKGMLDAFGAYGINRAMIEAKIQRKFEAIEPAQMVNMRQIYNSLQDGMSRAGDWFDFSLADKKEEPEGVAPAKAEKKPPTPKKPNMEAFKEKHATPEPDQDVKGPEKAENPPADVVKAADATPEPVAGAECPKCLGSGYRKEKGEIVPCNGCEGRGQL